MSKNLILEIPETEAGEIEAVLDVMNATLQRMEEESPRRHAEMERLTREGREIMRDVWATIEHVEKTR